MVELDAARASKLRGIKSLSSSSTAVSLFDPRTAARFGMFGAMPGFASMLKLFYDYLRALGLDPGLEMRAAMECAEELRIPILLGDQDATVTSANLNKAFSFSDIMKLASSPAMANNSHLKRLTQEMQEAMSRSGGDPLKALLNETFIERLKDRDMVRTHMQAVSSVAPKLFDALVGQRDRYMVQKLREDPGKRVVGVVGLGHLDGMEELLLAAAGKPLPQRQFIMIP